MNGVDIHCTLAVLRDYCAPKPDIIKINGVQFPALECSQMYVYSWLLRETFAEAVGLQDTKGY